MDDPASALQQLAGAVTSPLAWELLDALLRVGPQSTEALATLVAADVDVVEAWLIHLRAAGWVELPTGDDAEAHDYVLASARRPVIAAFARYVDNRRDALPPSTLRGAIEALAGLAPGPPRSARRVPGEFTGWIDAPAEDVRRLLPADRETLLSRTRGDTRLVDDGLSSLEGRRVLIPPTPDAPVFDVIPEVASATTALSAIAGNDLVRLRKDPLSMEIVDRLYRAAAPLGLGELAARTGNPNTFGRTHVLEQRGFVEALGDGTYQLNQPVKEGLVQLARAVSPERRELPVRIAAALARDDVVRAVLRTLALPLDAAGAPSAGVRTPSPPDTTAAASGDVLELLQLLGVGPVVNRAPADQPAVPETLVRLLGAGSVPPPTAVTAGPPHVEDLLQNRLMCDLVAVMAEYGPGRGPTRAELMSRVGGDAGGACDHLVRRAREAGGVTVLGPLASRRWEIVLEPRLRDAYELGRAAAALAVVDRSYEAAAGRVVACLKRPVHRTLRAALLSAGHPRRAGEMFGDGSWDPRTILGALDDLVHSGLVATTRDVPPGYFVTDGISAALARAVGASGDNTEEPLAVVIESGKLGEAAATRRPQFLPALVLACVDESTGRPPSVGRVIQAVQDDLAAVVLRGWSEGSRAGGRAIAIRLGRPARAAEKPMRALFESGLIRMEGLGSRRRAVVTLGGVLIRMISDRLHPQGLPTEEAETRSAPQRPEAPPLLHAPTRHDLARAAAQMGVRRNQEDVPPGHTAAALADPLAHEIALVMAYGVPVGRAELRKHLGPDAGDWMPAALRSLAEAAAIQGHGRPGDFTYTTTRRGMGQLSAATDLSRRAVISTERADVQARIDRALKSPSAQPLLEKVLDTPGPATLRQLHEVVQGRGLAVALDRVIMAGILVQLPGGPPRYQLTPGTREPLAQARLAGGRWQRRLCDPGGQRSSDEGASEFHGLRTRLDDACGRVTVALPTTRLLRIIADRIDRALLSAFSEGPQSDSGLAQDLGLARGTVEDHRRDLFDAGLVERVAGSKPATHTLTATGIRLCGDSRWWSGTPPEASACQEAAQALEELAEIAGGDGLETVWTRLGTLAPPGETAGLGGQGTDSGADAVSAVFGDTGGSSHHGTGGLPRWLPGIWPRW